MKKIIILLMLLSVIPFYNISNVKAEGNLLPNAKSGLLMEASTGTIIYEKNMHERVSVASMTKMVGMILIMEALEDGTITLDEKVKSSKHASEMGGSQIWLQEGEEMTVKELIKGIMMASANDAIVCMGERLLGTEAEFVKMMNEKVKELGLNNTHFVNATGFDENDHYSSAYDMGIIAKELLKHEAVLEYTSIYEDYLRTDSDNKFWLVNTNKLVRTYQGADGLKTGWTDAAGYCMAVTANRNNMRLIAIVLGEDSGKVRNAETIELLDYGFNLYEVTTIKKKGEVLGNIDIDKANIKNINIVANKDVTVLKKQSDKDVEYKSEIKLDTLKLPIKKGDRVGSLIVKDVNGNKIDEVSITVDVNIEKENLFKLFLKVIKNIVCGNLL